MPAPPSTSLTADDGSELQGAALLHSLSSRRDVAVLVGVPWQTLAWLLFRNGTDGYYNTWKIKKKSGGTREIRAPKSTLYRVQTALHPILQNSYQPRQAAHGFVKGRSVVTNASRHVNRRFVLNVDIADFFPSINFGRVRGLFLARPFECIPEVATILAQICCSDGSLPIGAPTSPVIANMICLRLDKELQGLARQCGSWYSRYADDLTFSTDMAAFPRRLAEVDDNRNVVLSDDLVGFIEENGFSPNPLKTRLQTSDQRQVVTGVIVNQRLNVNRRYVRRIRAMIHAWDKYGLEDAQSYVANWDSKDRFPGAAPKFQDILRGRISYLAMIRGPSDGMARRFLDQYDNLKAHRALNHGIAYAPESFVAVHVPEPRGRRQILTVMFTDIVDSTAQSAVLGDLRWRGIRENHDRLIRSQLARHRGREIKTMGDAFLATFDSPTEAVSCARAIITNIKPLGIKVRIGLHTGEVELNPEDVTGIGVVIGARVGAKAQASEVLVSQTVKDVLAGSGIVFQYRGIRALKGVPGKWRLYTVGPD